MALALLSVLLLSPCCIIEMGCMASVCCTLKVVRATNLRFGSNADCVLHFVQYYVVGAVRVQWGCSGGGGLRALVCGLGLRG